MCYCRQYISAKNEIDNLENEIHTLRGASSSDNEKWNKKELEYKEHIQKIENCLQSGKDLQHGRLKASLAEKLSELEQLRKECDTIQDQMEYMRRENDELRKKLDDYNKVSKIQRNISADSSAMDREIKQLKNR